MSLLSKRPSSSTLVGWAYFPSFIGSYVFNVTLTGFIFVEFFVFRVVYKIFIPVLRAPVKLVRFAQFSARPFLGRHLVIVSPVSIDFSCLPKAEAGSLPTRSQVASSVRRQ